MNKNSILFSQLDCGIIPLDNRNNYGWHKPANKLISFWLSGLPTLTSNTPAYIDAAGEMSNDILCADEDDWVEKLHKLREMKTEERAFLAKDNFDYAKSLYSNESHDSIWVNLFENLCKTQPLLAEPIWPEYIMNPSLAGQVLRRSFSGHSVFG